MSGPGTTRAADEPGTTRAAAEPGTTRAAAEPAPPTALVAGRLGVLGGTFDPIHLAHLAVAEEAREALGLERVLFVPAGRPWQKTDRAMSAPAHRLAMVEAAIAGNPAFESSRIEIDRHGPTYTVDTLEALATAERAAGREPDIWFILSTEALRGLDTWREPERVLELCRLAVAPRPPATDREAPIDTAWLRRHLPGRADRVHLLGGPFLRLSASDIRARVAAGRSVRYLVPDAVAAYIGDHALYTSRARRNQRP